MNYLSVENISKSYGDKLLFKDVSFGIEKGDKTALIAVNGAGKTTLLRLLTGDEEPDTGRIVFTEGIRLGYLPQDMVYDPNQTIEQYVRDGLHEVIRVKEAYHNLLIQPQHEHSPDYQQQLDQLILRMDALHAWDYDRRLKEMLHRFGLIDLRQKLGELSGGQLKRVALAVLLVDEPELILLDEPTNHLDISMIEWLEKYLSRQQITLLMVTHDRYFLDRICNQILELNFGALYAHQGNFSYYLEKSAQREASFRAETENAAQLLRRETIWMQRMPKARTTKSKSRITAFYELKEKAAVKRKHQQLHLNIEMQRIGSKILEMRNVSKAFGELSLLKNFDYMFTKGERIGIIGENGVGKTTLLNLITGELKPDTGRVIPGDTIVFGYYTQVGMQFPSDKKIIDVVKDIAEHVPLGNGTTASASQILTRFMFPPPVQNQQVELLSGGEKRRLYLLTVLINNPNFLLLDEPTNDLDLLTLQALEEFIRMFQGCLLIVSHDRYFMDQVVDQLFVFEGDGRVRGFVGNYSDYKEMLDTHQKKQKQLTDTEKPKPKPTQKADQQKSRRTFREQKEYEDIESHMHQLEVEKQQQLKQIELTADDFVAVEAASMRIGAIDNELERLMERWILLDDLEAY